MNNNIEKLVEDTLVSLDGIQRAEANPFLYTRIAQKMKNRYEPATYRRKLLPALALALVLFISLNVVSYFRVNTTGADSGYKSLGSGIENFANEYNLSEETGL
jgi:hypothetical protein